MSNHPMRTVFILKSNLTYQKTPIPFRTRGWCLAVSVGRKAQEVSFGTLCYGRESLWGIMHYLTHQYPSQQSFCYCLYNSTCSLFGILLQMLPPLQRDSQHDCSMDLTCGCCPVTNSCAVHSLTQCRPLPPSHPPHPAHHNASYQTPAGPCYR